MEPINNEQNSLITTGWRKALLWVFVIVMIAGTAGYILLRKQAFVVSSSLIPTMQPAQEPLPVTSCTDLNVKTLTTPNGYNYGELKALPEAQFEGVIGKYKEPPKGTNSIIMRDLPYHLNNKPLATPDDLSEYVGEHVVITGKNYQFQLEGSWRDEIWPISIACKEQFSEASLPSAGAGMTSTHSGKCESWVCGPPLDPFSDSESIYLKNDCKALSKLSVSDKNIAVDSEQEIIRAGISAKYFDEHFCLLDINDEHPSTRLLYWRYSINDYVAIFANYWNPSNPTVPDRNRIYYPLHDITYTISPKKAQELAESCTGGAQLSMHSVNYGDVYVPTMNNRAIQLQLFAETVPVSMPDGNRIAKRVRVNLEAEETSCEELKNLIYR